MANQRTTKVLVLGDSLSAEYGLRRGSGWVAMLEQRLRARTNPAVVVNASISGDTSAGALSRLPALLTQHKPTHVVIEIGANDALRGMPLTHTRDNLRAMARAAQATGAKVVLVGMQMAPNYGKDYGAGFARMYANLARSEHTALVPFFLAGVADAPDADRLFQMDRLHPNESAQARLLDNVLPVLQPLLP